MVCKKRGGASHVRKKHEDDYEGAHGRLVSCTARDVQRLEHIFGILVIRATQQCKNSQSSRINHIDGCLSSHVD